MHDNQLYGELPTALEALSLAGTLKLGLDTTLCATQPIAQSDYEVRLAEACDSYARG